MTRARKETASSSQADPPSGRRSRRQALALAGAAAAAATVAALGVDRGRRAGAATGRAMIIGERNEADPGDRTHLDADVDTSAFVVVNRHIDAAAGGVAGATLGHGAGVAGHSNHGTGVEGRGPSGVGVHGDTFDGIGVRAQCLGAANPERPMGPELALDVIGKARFSTAGPGIVPARADAAAVENRAVTEDSHISLTFAGDPDRARLAWVERQAGRGFIAHLSSRPRRDVPFTYFIVGGMM
ncbi:MAG: hypothetical protein Q8P22_10945 [Chloroflexota bacterium]|nr:hypothetical protein [Chloroflexota bacterium]